MRDVNSFEKILKRVHLVVRKKIWEPHATPDSVLLNF